MILAGARLVAVERSLVPLLLLDEVVAHLDAYHRDALFTTVADLGAQAWYAGTDVGAFAPLARCANFITLGEPRPLPHSASCLAATIGEKSTG
jgi:DNA replication and repair protein RecF